MLTSSAIPIQADAATTAEDLRAQLAQQKVGMHFKHTSFHVRKTVRMLEC